MWGAVRRCWTNTPFVTHTSTILDQHCLTLGINRVPVCPTPSNSTRHTFIWMVTYTSTIPAQHHLTSVIKWIPVCSIHILASKPNVAWLWWTKWVTVCPTPSNTTWCMRVHILTSQPNGAWLWWTNVQRVKSQFSKTARSIFSTPYQGLKMWEHLGFCYCNI
jgi:hypothetical protein